MTPPSLKMGTDIIKNKPPRSKLLMFELLLANIHWHNAVLKFGIHNKFLKLKKKSYDLFIFQIKFNDYKNALSYVFQIKVNNINPLNPLATPIVSHIFGSASLASVEQEKSKSNTNLRKVKYCILRSALTQLVYLSIYHLATYSAKSRSKRSVGQFT